MSLVAHSSWAVFVVTLMISFKRHRACKKIQIYCRHNKKTKHIRQKQTNKEKRISLELTHVFYNSVKCSFSCLMQTVKLLRQWIRGKKHFCICNFFLSCVFVSLHCGVTFQFSVIYIGRVMKVWRCSQRIICFISTYKLSQPFSLINSGTDTVNTILLQIRSVTGEECLLTFNKCSFKILRAL